MSCPNAPYFTHTHAYCIYILYSISTSPEKGIPTTTHTNTPPEGVSAYSIHFPYSLETQHGVIKPAAIHELNGTL